MADHPHLACFHGKLESVVDFVISSGGDGTMLHVSSLFQKSVPPILSFSLGTLNFLCAHELADYESAIASTFAGGFLITPRMRLMCSVTDRHQSFMEEYHITNDVAIHRGQVRAVNGAFSLLNFLNFPRIPC